MTLHRSVITPPPKQFPRPPSPLVDVAVVCIVLWSALILGSMVYVRVTEPGTAAPSLLDQLRERRVCPLSLEVQLAMDRAEQVRIVGDGTCEDPLRIVK